MNLDFPAGAVRAIFFDAVGTLLHPSPLAHEVYAEVGAKFGHFLPTEIIRTRFREAFQLQEQHDARNDWATSEKRELRRWQEIVRTVFEDDKLFSQLWQHFAEPSAWRVIPEAGEVLAELSRRSFVLGLASNFDRRLHTVAAGFPELEPLGIRLISSEIGCRKPSPKFFEALVKAAGCTPQQILYVGDNPANDYEGATAAGLRAVLVDEDSERLRELLNL
ncbi:MAG TPA: HAD-IA family hydrolase [Gemmataceae bacterium]|jgi:putative hydrolase of the HAD superfamily|nr:HAD-IA family hydrolase [Gemmataceae bacterium]